MDPLDPISTTGASIPFTGGMFEQLNESGSATAGTTLEFGVPIGDDTEFGFDVEFTWQELSRVVVIPEPGSSLSALLGAGLIAARRRRPGKR